MLAGLLSLRPLARWMTRHRSKLVAQSQDCREVVAKGRCLDGSAPADWMRLATFDRLSEQRWQRRSYATACSRL